MRPAEEDLVGDQLTRDIPRRKHRQGLHRTQIACERCRVRKNKCDGKAPSCSTCEKAGTPCIVVDRLTYRQYPRGHVEDLEARVEVLQKENSNLKAEFQKLQHSQQSSQAHSVEGTLGSQDVGAASTCGDLALDIGLLSLEGASERKYVGESSGVHFGKVIETLLPHVNPDGQPVSSPPQLDHFRLRFGCQATDMSAVALSTGPAQPVPIPAADMADRLQEAYFSHRWPSLPFLHRPTFFKKHYEPVLRLGDQADRVSLFLTHMVFAIGAIDLRRQKLHLPATHLYYFKTATSFYFTGFLANDNLETIQGLLLMSAFAINEPQSLNAWMVSGLAMRLAIDLGLHREVRSSGYNLFQSEMRKRVFWAAYALDRNISIALGRPLGIQDRDINVELPLPFSDDDLTREDIALGSSQALAPTIHDLSTFIHIIKLRQLGSKIQTTLYPTGSSMTDPLPVHAQRNNLRAELEEWIEAAPRYKPPTPATFQSVEWFQIAYNHMLLLIYRPSPACSVATVQELQTCGDASISLITLFVTLYSKNKITYTWVSLHSLFMASITMLYTLTRPEIRQGTTKEVTKSNILSCLSLFENMGELWPAAAERCYQVIERLGRATLALFETGESLGYNETATVDFVHPPPVQGAFGETTLDYLDWFGTRQHSGVIPLLPEAFNAESSTRGGSQQDQTLMDGNLNQQFNYDGSMDLDGLLNFSFDMSLPLMTDAFDRNDMFEKEIQGMPYVAT